MAKTQTILGIETSCDETAAAVLSFDGRKYKVLGNAVASQIELHRLTGGVVPEVAAREHVATMMPVIKLALKKAGLKKEDLDAIAVTAGPGLLPALMVGVDTANALSLALGIPAIPVQHISGHIYANFVDEKTDLDKIKFPLLALVVSGGHSEFILMRDHLKFKKIGHTVDDAAGEAFDKSAKILGLPYPGGPEISKAALTGNPQAYDFPRPLVHENNFNFSFAGLKTAVLYKAQELGLKKIKAETNNLAASVQEAIIDVLVNKTVKAIEKYKPATFTLGGGVAANKLLRQRLSETLAEKFPKLNYFQPKIEYSTDNAVMIAAVGALMLNQKTKIPRAVKVDPQWEL